MSPLGAVMLLVAIAAVVIALFLPTARSITAIWSSSETFTHGWLVLPAFLWFVWQRRAALAATTLRPSWLGFVVIACAGTLWLLGELSGTQVPTHFALVLLVIGAVLAVTGLAWGRILAFPLFFLFFAVPFGESAVPLLMDWTAHFTVWALQLSGVPVFREGNDFQIPSGRWSVVEACSGVRYLLASLMVGTLYAWVMYRSPGRRALFMLASLLVPIVANWLRAYLIVMLGHLSGNRIAAGVDHLIYGWVFFGVVIFALFAVGARWREDDAPAAVAPMASGASAHAPRLAVGAAAGLGALALWPVLANAMLAPADVRPIAAIAPAAVEGWRETAVEPTRWRPQLQQPRAFGQWRFVAGGEDVSVHVGWFRAQTQGSELVSSMNTVAAEKSGWRQVSRGEAAADIAGVPMVWRDVVVRRESGGYERLWIGYWLGERWTASDTQAKLDLAFDRLRMHADTSAWVALAAPHEPEVPQRSEAALREFVATMGPSLQRALQESTR
jgi:exosortase A